MSVCDGCSFMLEGWAMPELLSSISLELHHLLPLRSDRMAMKHEFTFIYSQHRHSPQVAADTNRRQPLNGLCSQSLLVFSLVEKILC